MCRSSPGTSSKAIENHAETQRYRRRSPRSARHEVPDCAGLRHAELRPAHQGDQGHQSGKTPRHHRRLRNAQIPRYKHDQYGTGQTGPRPPISVLCPSFRPPERCWNFSPPTDARSTASGIIPPTASQPARIPSSPPSPSASRSSRAPYDPAVRHHT